MDSDTATPYIQADNRAIEMRSSTDSESFLNESHPKSLFPCSCSVPSTRKILLIAVVAVTVLLLIIVPWAVVSSAKSASSSSSNADVDTPSAVTNSSLTGKCSKSITMVEGPYWVDEDLDRSDVTGGSTGMPLNLKATIYTYNPQNCTVITNAKVDIWHANSGGKYSDKQSEGTLGQTFLRGYQLTDAYGLASFTTVYPGWYQGRTQHIHLRVRLYEGGRLTYTGTTQTYFDDTITDTVYTTSYYSSRGTRTTRNNNDSMYNKVMEWVLSGSNTAGYTGTLAFGVPFT